MPYRVPGPPPPPPYALSDLPPSYTATAAPQEGQGADTLTAPSAPAPPTGTEQPPPYAVAIKRDHLVQGAVVGEEAPPPAASAVQPHTNNSRSNRNLSSQRRNRVVLWY